MGKERNDDLRDLFAANALSNPYSFHDGNPEKVAEWAYQIADAMICARNELYPVIITSSMVEAYKTAFQEYLDTVGSMPNSNFSWDATHYALSAAFNSGKNKNKIEIGATEKEAGMCHAIEFVIRNAALNGIKDEKKLASDIMETIRSFPPTKDMMSAMWSLSYTNSKSSFEDCWKAIIDASY